MPDEAKKKDKVKTQEEDVSNSLEEKKRFGCDYFLSFFNFIPRGAFLCARSKQERRSYSDT